MLNFSSETEATGYAGIERDYYMELGHLITEADKTQYLQGASEKRRSKRANGLYLL